jgi:hypothetical protein
MTSASIAESHVEEAALAWLGELGYCTASGLSISRLSTNRPPLVPLEE